jgi:putative ABC transport system permease protein
VASVGPALSASKATIVTYKQEQARTFSVPFWQRTYLDVLMLVVALYGYYLLGRRGTISYLVGLGETGSPFSNPFLFLVPVLFVFALSLFSIRLFPAAMRTLAWLANVARGAVAVLALRHLSRTARQYAGPLLLLILTLSLAVFTASMARTLDGYIVSRAYYDTGADARLIEVGQSAQVGAGFDGGAGTSTDVQGPVWLFLPVTEHLSIAGVQDAARVLTKNTTAKVQGKNVKGELVGIDRVDFPRVAYFRRDFAPASLGALMNALAVRNDAILISRDILNQGVEVGDRITLVIPLGDSPKVDFAVAGVVDMFPRMYPEDGPFFIANLDYIFDTVGGMYPYDVWLKTAPSVDPQTLRDDAMNLGLNVINVFDARQDIDRVQLAPERQGVFGLLSVGFVVAALLTVLGFLIYSYISFTRRYIELGVLRAIGLSVGQMTLVLIAEQLTLILTGAVVGTALGVLVSRLFIPFLQVEGGKHPFTPPFVVEIAWTEVTYIYAVFGAMFLGAVVVLLFALRRVRIFEAIKMGESA